MDLDAAIQDENYTICDVIPLKLCPTCYPKSSLHLEILYKVRPHGIFVLAEYCWLKDGYQLAGMRS